MVIYIKLLISENMNIINNIGEDSTDVGMMNCPLYLSQLFEASTSNTHNIISFVIFKMFIRITKIHSKKGDTPSQTHPTRCLSSIVVYRSYLCPTS